MKQSTQDAINALRKKMQKKLEKAKKETPEADHWREEYDLQNVDYIEKQCKEVYQAILDGQIYASIASVSQSGMSRRILFYLLGINENDKNDSSRRIFITRVTAVIGWLSGLLPIGEYEQRGKRVTDSGLYVSGCGMDMIFHTLYSCIEYDPSGNKNWNQHYNIL